VERVEREHRRANRSSGSRDHHKRQTAHLDNQVAEDGRSMTVRLQKSRKEQQSAVSASPHSRGAKKIGRCQGAEFAQAYCEIEDCPHLVQDEVEVREELQWLWAKHNVSGGTVTCVRLWPRLIDTFVRPANGVVVASSWLNKLRNEADSPLADLQMTACLPRLCK